MRLDKFLANSGSGSRSDVKKCIKSGKVTVDNVIVTAPEFKINPESNIVAYNKNIIKYQEYTYIMLNKPAGIICATKDDNEKTVIDLLSANFQKLGLFPVGRLDKDTTGLVILSNNGNFAHNTLSPRKHISKKYFAVVEGIVDKIDIEKFEKGIIINNEYKCKSADLIIKDVNIEKNLSEIEIIISEGKFHQIKKMFAAVGKKVIYLKRIRFGEIYLDNTLKEGEYRELLPSEMQKVKNYIE